MKLEEEIEKMLYEEIDIGERIRKMSKSELRELVNRIREATEKGIREYEYWGWYLRHLLKIADSIYSMLSSAEYYEERGLSVGEMREIEDEAFEVGKKIRGYGLG